MARITGHTLDAMRAAITALDKPEHRERYRNRDIPRGELVQDIDMRYRWDLYWAAGGYRLLPDEDSFKSAHIDTALRSIVPPL